MDLGSELALRRSGHQVLLTKRVVRAWVSQDDSWTCGAGGGWEADGEWVLSSVLD